MKKISILYILLLLFSSLVTIYSLETMFNKKDNLYFRVVLEKPNGIDIRENVMPRAIIDMIEKQGKIIRPSRTIDNIGYWCFFKNGDFATLEAINNPDLADLSFDELEQIFASAPRDGTKWAKRKGILIIGGRKYSIKILEKDDSLTGGRKDEIEIAVLNNKKKVYYYFGSIIQNNKNEK